MTVRVLNGGPVIEALAIGHLKEAVREIAGRREMAHSQAEPEGAVLRIAGREIVDLNHVSLTAACRARADLRTVPDLPRQVVPAGTKSRCVG